MASKEFFGQKPIAFDPFTGSITVPSLAGVGASFQYVVRDSPSARKDLVLANGKLRGDFFYFLLSTKNHIYD
jgi:small ligand-binding sensory domain FIST